MRPRILCPKHIESTPSCVLYDDHFKCFGCGAYGTLESLGLGSNTRTYVDTVPPEDVKESLEYVNSLPKEPIRGLELHTDERNYYIVWPDGAYYKSRSKSSEDNSKKYYCPKGVPKPPFFIRSGKQFSWYKKALMVVEGEINALSIAQCCSFIDILSPGGSGDFTSEKTKKALPFFQQYNKILLIADADKAGAEAVMGLAGFLRSNGIKTYAKLMDKDANDLLTGEGREALEKQIRSYLAELLERK